jgi:signal transduction histidine kinase
MLGSVVAVAVVVVGGFFVLRSVAIDEAEQDIRDRVQVQGRLVEVAGLGDGVLRGDPRALARLDVVVLGQILDESVMRVKLWSEDGRILYSDHPALIGRRYRLEADERLVFRTGGAEAELSDLSEPENRYEREEGKLLEAYTPIRTPNGTPVLFEIYQRFGSVSSSAENLLGALTPPLLAGLAVLLAFQVPLAWSMADRLRRGHRERERLLADAIAASTSERWRIAADLHDGVVQDLAGVAFGLAPLAEDASRRGAHEEAVALRTSIDRLRQGVRGLRTLLVEIHPPNLETAGLEAALADLLSPLETEGVVTELQVDPHPSSTELDPLVYRVASEAIRNARAHSGASRVRISVMRPGPESVRLVVEDDGRGIPEDLREERAAGGHLGLSLVEGLAKQAGGALSVRSEPGSGTIVELKVPAP